MYKLYFQPFPNEPEDADEFYALLGRCSVLWGRLDCSMEAILATLMEFPSAAPIKPKEIPVSFKRKVKLWRKAYRTLPEVAQFKDKALAFATDAVKLSARRTSIIHSVLGFDARQREVIGLQYMQRGGETFYRTFLVRQRDLENLMHDLIVAMRPLNLVAFHAMALTFPKGKQKP